MFTNDAFVINRLQKIAEIEIVRDVRFNLSTIFCNNTHGQRVDTTVTKFVFFITHVKSMRPEEIQNQTIDL
jgi:hypothetical protein